MPENAFFAGGSSPGAFANLSMAFAALPLPFQYGFVAVFGLVIGSFLSVVVHRLPIMLERAWRDELETLTDQDSDVAAPAYNLWLPGSACPHCGHKLAVWENIPLFSFLFLRGRCSACRAPIGWLYPTLEAATALLAMGLLWRYGPSAQALTGFALGATLLALAAIDARTQLLPDSLTLPLLWAGLLINLAGPFTSIGNAVIGAAAGYTFLWLVYWGFRLLRGKEGIGYGDFKLLAALGAWFGWQALPQLLLISAVAGAAVGILALVSGRLQRDQPLPFGPFLALAGIVTVFIGIAPYGSWGG